MTVWCYDGAFDVWRRGLAIVKVAAAAVSVSDIQTLLDVGAKPADGAGVDWRVSIDDAA